MPTRINLGGIIMKHRNRRNRYLPIMGIVIFSFGGLLLNSTTASADTNTTTTQNTKSATQTTLAKSQSASSASVASDTTTASASMAKTSAAASANSITPQSDSTSTVNKPSASTSSTVLKSSTKTVSSENSITSQKAVKQVSKAAPVKTSSSNIQPNSQTKSVTALSATSTTSTTNPTHYLTMQLANVPSGIYFKTGSSYAFPEEFVGNHGFFLGQSLSPNTTWTVKQIATDNNNTTYYNLGENNWVQESASIFINTDNNAPLNTQYTPVTSVNNNLKNQPVISNQPLSLHLNSESDMYFKEFSLPAVHDLGTTYTGSHNFITHSIFIGSNNVLWLNVNQNVWIDLSGDTDYIPQENLSITPFPPDFLSGLKAACDTALNGMNTMVSAIHDVNTAVTSLTNTLNSTKQPIEKINNSLSKINSNLNVMNQSVKQINSTIPSTI